MNPDKIKAMDDVFKSRFADFEGTVTSTSQENIFKKLDQQIVEDSAVSSPKDFKKLPIFKQIKFYYLAAAILIFMLGVNFIINFSSYKSIENSNKNIVRITIQKPTIAPIIHKIENFEIKKLEDVKSVSLPVSNQEMVCINKSADIQEVNLPDGSKIFLNKNASISYAKDFDKRRFIKFTGEAYFEVKKMNGLPFTIEGKQSIITVLGTSFNVKFDSITGIEKVEVVSGKVKFESIKLKKNNLILTKGFSGTNDKLENNLIKESISNINFMAWKDKNLVFVDAPLSQVLQDLEHCYGVKIEMPSTQLLKCRFTGNFKNESLDKVSKLIASTLDLELHHTTKSITFTGKGCTE